VHHSLAAVKFVFFVRLTKVHFIDTFRKLEVDIMIPSLASEAQVLK